MISRHWQFARGFTLIELMIVVSIIAIIAVIAYPNYRSYILRANRADAKVGLVQIYQEMERCLTQYSVYNNTNCNVVGAGPAVSIASDEGYYQIQASGANLTASTYTLTAAAQGGQTDDTACTSITLTHLGIKAPVACW